MNSSKFTPVAARQKRTSTAPLSARTFLRLLSSTKKSLGNCIAHQSADHYSFLLFLLLFFLFFFLFIITSRIAVAAETFLIEANARGAEFGKPVHCFVVGLGLGVWARHPVQSQLYVDEFGKALVS